MSGCRKALGKMGEDKAEAFLKKHRYKILERNFLTKSGEIDIIAMDGKTLVFVEVKTRSGEEYGRPADAVGYYKKKHIIAAALIYIEKNSLYDTDARFDVIEVFPADKGFLKKAGINHIKEAFEINDV